MTPMSSTSGPLPSLYVRAGSLSPEVAERLNDKLLPGFSSAVYEYFWGLVEKLNAVLLALPDANLPLTDRGEARLIVIELIKAIMHEIAALSEYLGDALAIVLPAIGKRNKEASLAKAQMSSIVNPLFKAPINLIKHERFRLLWVELSTASIVTAGYCLVGIVEPREEGSSVTRRLGPASRRRHTASGLDFAEGYSFAYVLREVLPTVYKLCDVTENALATAKLFKVGDVGGTPHPAGSRAILLNGVLASLAALSRYGFPNEKGIRLPQLVRHNQGVCVGTTFKLREFKHGFKVSSELGTNIKGEGAYLPYWPSGLYHD